MLKELKKYLLQNKDIKPNQVPYYINGFLTATTFLISAPWISDTPFRTETSIDIPEKTCNAGYYCR